ncbi:MAG: hypothetical protein WBP61_09900 [Nocardioides sp.]
MELTIHAGMGKTGTSSIQAFCREHREQLRGAGLLYPRSPGIARHGRLGMFLKSDEELAIAPNWQRLQASDPTTDPARFRQTFRRRLRTEIDEAGLDRVLLSDEEIFGMSDEGLQRLARFGRRISSRLRMVIYLRRQDDHLVSRYQQGVKIGWIARLDEWALEDMTHLYDYATRLRRHEELVAPDEIVVRRYERDGFVRGSLHDDFLDAVGVSVDPEDRTPVPDRNLSLDAESVEFLRLLNVHRVRATGASVGLIDNRDLVRRLARASTGPVLTLSPTVLDPFMASWHEPNREVARRYFGTAEGDLFHADRKATGTTTRQRLDPDRLDHFLEVGEIAEEWHAPLRRLAAAEVTRD